LVKAPTLPGRVKPLSVSHSAGTPGEPVIVIGLLALKPVAAMYMFATVLVGAYGVVELPTAMLPRLTVADAVTVNEAVAVFPSLSVTVTNCVPGTELTVPDGTWYRNTDVPCSVTAGVPGIRVVTLVVVGAVPKVTPLKVAVGPNPAAVTVTYVPTGPEVGESVTVGVVRAKVVVPVLLQLSVKVNDDPEVMAGRLTVPAYAPETELTVLLLNEDGEVAEAYPVTAGSGRGVVIVTVIVRGLVVPISAEPAGMVPVKVRAIVTAA